jgi:hypothetical protein
MVRIAMTGKTITTKELSEKNSVSVDREIMRYNQGRRMILGYSFHNIKTQQPQNQIILHYSPNLQGMIGRRLAFEERQFH